MELSKKSKLWITEAENQAIRKLARQLEEIMMFVESTINPNQKASEMATQMLISSVKRGKTPAHRIGKLDKLIKSLDMENIYMAIAIIQRYEGETD